MDLVLFDFDRVYHSLIGALQRRPITTTFAAAIANTCIKGPVIWQKPKATSKPTLVLSLCGRDRDTQRPAAIFSTNRISNEISIRKPVNTVYCGERAQLIGIVRWMDDTELWSTLNRALLNTFRLTLLQWMTAISEVSASAQLVKLDMCVPSTRIHIKSEFVIVNGCALRLICFNFHTIRSVRISLRKRCRQTSIFIKWTFILKLKHGSNFGMLQF